jgi:D-methionine transport system ATP-binding protein
MIKLIDICKNFQNKQTTSTVLKKISFEVSKGEIFGIIGKSGAGKSTLLRVVNLLEKPCSGTVWFDNVCLNTLKESELRTQRKKMGMIFQHFHLLSSKTVFENIALPLQLCNNENTAQIKTRVFELLDVTGLLGKDRFYPGQLSGGQKQRVAIARALATCPKVLLCDEATSALDPETTQSILGLLKKINENFGVTILLITHEMDVIKTICDKVALLENGAFIKNTSVTDFFCQRNVSKTKWIFDQGHDTPSQQAYGTALSRLFS